MEPKIVEGREKLVAGTLYEGRNENQEIAVMWDKEFNPNAPRIKMADDKVFYGVCEMDAGLPDGAFRYVAAAEIARPEDAPPDLYQMRIPAAKWAVYEHHGALETLGQTYQKIYAEWLPQAGLKRAPGPDLEVYTDDFKDFKEDSILYLWVPIE
jgi:AraC family transcriptional regulator